MARLRTSWTSRCAKTLLSMHCVRSHGHLAGGCSKCGGMFNTSLYSNSAIHALDVTFVPKEKSLEGHAYTSDGLLIVYPNRSHPIYTIPPFSPFLQVHIACCGVGALRSNPSRVPRTPVLYDAVTFFHVHNDVAASIGGLESTILAEKKDMRAYLHRSSGVPRLRVSSAPFSGLFD